MNTNLRIIKKKKTIHLLTAIVTILLVAVNSCKKEEEPEPAPPPNPYDEVNYGGTTNNSTPPDPNSFVGIHTNIFKTRCAMPGCHDGNFEPDFRTVQSAYATLVYHRVKKKLSPWVFRVAPGDTANSWLWQRINHELIVSGADTSQGRMPLYSSMLPASEMSNIRTWILNGAKDMFGYTPTYPNTEPRIQPYYYATNSSFSIDYGKTENRMDSIYYNPFFLPDNTSINLAFFVEDDSTAVSAMLVNKLKISLNPNDFSAPIGIYTATYVNFPPNPPLHLVSINTAILPKSDTLFMRYFVNDGDHTNDTYFPTDNLPFPYKTYWSFYINP